MSVDVSTSSARVALIGATVDYHGSLTHHHGTAVVVETCGTREFCGSETCDLSTEPRYVLRTEGVEPRELWHVRPASFTRT